MKNPRIHEGIDNCSLNYKMIITIIVHSNNNVIVCCPVPNNPVCVAVLSCGSRGISQSAIRLRMNIGKLESRMICRRLERSGLIKVR